tara:strand:+ start:315 stop:425 length:111 start_codon:yes stop_codon:yes gene_type:complete
MIETAKDQMIGLPVINILHIRETMKRRYIAEARTRK